MLWNTLNLFFNSQLNDGNSHSGDAQSNPEFPKGQLTSTAWEGWWDNPAQA
ncbi:hypothetical protein [Arthrobacter sp. D1-17]